MSYYIGIDVGGTNLVAGLVEESGAIRHKVSQPVDRSMDGDALSRLLAQLARRAAQEGNVPLADVRAVGAGFPGLVDNRTGVVVQTANMPFDHTPVRALFQSIWDVPFFLGNDANCAAIGEYWAGAAKGCDPAVVVTLGTGIGSGMVSGGKLFTGFANSGMETGHTIIYPGGVPCTCGNRGCWERYGSATALIRMAREEMAQSPDSLLWTLCGGQAEKVQGRTVFQAAREKDPAALRALETFHQGLAIGLINLVNTVQPEIICLGGGISAADDDLLLDPVRALVKQGSYDKTMPTRLEHAALGNDAGVVGAAMLCEMV